MFTWFFFIPFLLFPFFMNSLKNGEPDVLLYFI